MTYLIDRFRELHRFNFTDIQVLIGHGEEQTEDEAS
jgi:hypothetical protein